MFSNQNIKWSSNVYKKYKNNVDKMVGQSKGPIAEGRIAFIYHENVVLVLTISMFQRAVLTLGILLSSLCAHKDWQ